MLVIFQRLEWDHDFYVIPTDNGLHRLYIRVSGVILKWG